MYDQWFLSVCYKYIKAKKVDRVEVSGDTCILLNSDTLLEEPFPPVFVYIVII